MYISALNIIESIEQKVERFRKVSIKSKWLIFTKKSSYFDTFSCFLEINRGT